MESFENIDKLEAKPVDKVEGGSDKVDVASLEQKNHPSDVSEVDDREYVDSSAINPSRNTEDPHFYDGGKSSQEDYAALAENIPEVRDRLAAGESIDTLCADEKVGDCANAYFKEDKMLTVRDEGDGSYQLIDDGNHRLKAAQDLGYEVPVKFGET
ncbi:MAG: ParB/Srx family N-terminal domain-containing protein [Oscillospiraceae bacterium]|jgi:hypothetical protein|nr:ParB/Srx family N-terminal domain-containing protein [Oscillospiraceae bacterium]